MPGIDHYGGHVEVPAVASAPEPLVRSASAWRGAAASTMRLTFAGMPFMTAWVRLRIMMGHNRATMGARYQRGLRANVRVSRVLLSTGSRSMSRGIRILPSSPRRAVQGDVVSLGNAAFTIAVSVSAIAFLKLDSGPHRVVAIAIVVLVRAQIGLGYSTRDSEGAAALHIPLGVAVFGAVIYQLLVAWPALIGQRRQPSPNPTRCRLISQRPQIHWDGGGRYT